MKITNQAKSLTFPPGNLGLPLIKLATTLLRRNPQYLSIAVYFRNRT